MGCQEKERVVMEKAIDVEKDFELDFEFNLLRTRFEDLCKHHRGIMLEYKPFYKRRQKTLIMDCLIGTKNAEKVQKIYCALISASIKDTHFKMSKGYTKNQFCSIRYYIRPDWEYFLGDKYLHRDEDYKVPTPQEVEERNKTVVK